MHSIHKKNISIARKYQKIGNILDSLFGTVKEVDEHLIDDKSQYSGSEYFGILEKKSRSLQSKLTPILKVLKFDANQSTASESIKKAIDHFQKKAGNLTTKPPMEFLSNEEKQEVISNGHMRISLYKALFFRRITDNIKSGSLNLQASYKFKALDGYMISKEEWETDKDLILKQAGLEKFRDSHKILKTLGGVLNAAYIKTNSNIINGSNKYITVKGINDFVLNTPAIDNVEGSLSDYLPDARTVPMQEILSTVSNLSEFLKSFEYYKTSHGRQSTSELLIAGIMSLGYGMGNNDVTIQHTLSGIQNFL